MGSSQLFSCIETASIDAFRTTLKSKEAENRNGNSNRFITAMQKNSRVASFDVFPFCSELTIGSPATLSVAILRLRKTHRPRLVLFRNSHKSAVWASAIQATDQRGQR